MNSLIDKTVDFVKTTLKGAEAGHDWFHIERVWKMAKRIAEEEKKKNEVNLTIVELGALLHDIADHKFHGGDDTVGPATAKKFLSSLNADEKDIEHVCNIIKDISFKGSNTESAMKTLEGKIVQDADRIDALGAIGIARTIAYGGFKNRELFNPEIEPKLNMTWEEYKKHSGPSINHFYEKILLLKDLMNTETGKQIALKRHAIVENYLNQFKSEWNGEC